MLTYCITAMDFDVLELDELEDAPVPMREVRTHSKEAAALIARCFDPGNVFVEVVK